MDPAGIIVLVFVWLIFGMLGVGFAVDVLKLEEDRRLALIFFWPVTLPIVLVFWVAWAIVEAFKYGFSLFGVGNG